jgi:hypothetical protein
MRETWESLIRDFVRHLKRTNRALNPDDLPPRDGRTRQPRVLAGTVSASAEETDTTGTSVSASADEQPLTGDTKTKVEAAVLAAYPGATIERSETDTAASTRPTSPPPTATSSPSWSARTSASPAPRPAARTEATTPPTTDGEHGRAGLMGTGWWAAAAVVIPGLAGSVSSRGRARPLLPHRPDLARNGYAWPY